MGRATFYAHFASKDDLLRSQLTRVVLPMLRVRAETPYLLDCRGFFAHVASAPQLFKSLMGGRERSGARVIREVMEQHLETILTAPLTMIEHDLPIPLLKRFVVSTLLAVAVHRLQGDTALTAKEMQLLFGKLVGSGLSRDAHEDAYQDAHQGAHQGA